MKILIVEDDILIATHLSEIITEIDLEHEVHCAHNEEQALVNVKSIKPDLVILDIRMESNDSGLKLAAQIKKDYGIPHAFITAQSDKINMDKAFETFPLGYIVKPFRTPDIYALLKVASQTIQEEYFEIGSTNQVTRIPMREILYLKAENNYVDICTTRKKYTIRTSLKTAQTKLPESRFVQTHRSYIINKDHISLLTKSYVTIDGYKIPLSKVYAHLLE
jgi:two-component system, LytTR family, response regulator LytT